jgi:triosephosphate isomerase (TIM)
MTAKRTPIIAGNWKMNTTIAEGLALVDQLLPQLEAFPTVDRVVCPPFISLASVAERVRGTELRVGAQNLHPEPKGAFTGEIAPGMLADLVQYVILGHSERRQYFSEDDAFVNRKVKAAFEVGLTPIVCVGESLEQNERGETEGFVSGQIRASLAGLERVQDLVVAYEPIWAIGTGRAATPEGANATIAMIRRTISDVSGSAVAEAVRIQYGGSVTGDNFAAFIEQPDIDGALVGGASLRADQFTEIVRLAAAAQ